MISFSARLTGLELSYEKKQPVLTGSQLNKARSRLAGPARFSYDSSKIFIRNW